MVYTMCSVTLRIQTPALELIDLPFSSPINNKFILVIMNGLDVRITDLDLVLKKCKISSFQFNFGAVSCCISTTNDSSPGGTFLVFKSPCDEDINNAFNGPICVSLISTNRGVIGKGKSPDITFSSQSKQSGFLAALSPSFQQIGHLETNIVISHEEKDKPDLLLGSIKIVLSLYSLALVKECPHQVQENQQTETDKESSFATCDSPFISEAVSDSSDEDMPSDTSLENFYHNLRARNQTGPKEKLCSSTQTIGSKIRKMNIREQPAQRRRDKKEVVAVLAPNPYQRPSTEVSYYAFMESPSEVTSRSMMSLSSQGSVRHTGRTGHGSAMSGSAAPRRLQQGSRDPTGIAGERPRSAPPTQKPDNPDQRGVPHKVFHRLIARPPTPVSVAIEGKSTEAKVSTTAKPTLRPWR